MKGQSEGVRFGRDILSRIIYGARIALIVGVLAVLGRKQIAAFAFPADRSESNRQAQINLGWRATPKLEVSGFARIYEGFPDFRSVWIAEFYEQSFGFVPGYRDADPQGWAVGTSITWNVVPGATRLIFDRDAWESVSARVMLESGKAVLVVPPPTRDDEDKDEDAEGPPV